MPLVRQKASNWVPQSRWVVGSRSSGAVLVTRATFVTYPAPAFSSASTSQTTPSASISASPMMGRRGGDDEPLSPLPEGPHWLARDGSPFVLTIDWPCRAAAIISGGGQKELFIAGSVCVTQCNVLWMRGGLFVLVNIYHLPCFARPHQPSNPAQGSGLTITSLPLTLREPMWA